MRRWLFLWGFLLTVGVALGQTEPYRLRVLSWSCKTFSKGVLVQGVVRNVGSRPLADLRVNLRVVGPGLRMATGSAPLADRSLVPGESARFELRMRTTFEGPHRCDLWFRNPRVARIATLVPNPR